MGRSAAPPNAGWTLDLRFFKDGDESYLEPWPARFPCGEGSGGEPQRIGSREIKLETIARMNSDFVKAALTERRAGAE